MTQPTQEQVVGWFCRLREAMQLINRGHGLSAERAKECTMLYDLYLRTIRLDESTPTLSMMADLTLEEIEEHATRAVEILNEAIH